MHDHPYLERLRELTKEFSQEQNPLKRNEILEGIVSLITTRAPAQETGNHTANLDLASKPEPDVETKPGERESKSRNVHSRCQRLR